VDVKALEEQVKEKRRLEEEERRLEEAYLEQKRREGQLLQLLDRQKELVSGFESVHHSAKFP